MCVKLIKYKNITLRSLLLLGLAIGTPLAFSACSKDKDQQEIPGEEININDIFVNRLESMVSNLNGILTNAVFGDKKGNYPRSARVIISDRLAYVEETLEKVLNGSRKLSRSDMDNIILETSSTITRFKNTELAADFVPQAAELYVEGKSGGYIDFGANPAFSTFDNGFTVEFWVKFANLGNFDYILSTFIDNFNSQDNYRHGWAANFYGEGGNSLIRMSYALGKDGLYEPGVNNFRTVNQWVHLAYVWNPSKFSDGNADPAHFKMYINGELVKAEDWGRTDYTPNDKTSLIGFNFTNFDGSISQDGKGTNGYMRHMHIWNAVKNQDQLRSIMNTPTSVTGKEADLVCGWELTHTQSDDTNILDITGKYTAKVVGNYSWIK